MYIKSINRVLFLALLIGALYLTSCYTVVSLPVRDYDYEEVYQEDPEYYEEYNLQYDYPRYK
ncbi:hypothetical protein ACFL7D_08010 [candidate division KSB1 bacterium]